MKKLARYIVSQSSGMTKSASPLETITQFLSKSPWAAPTLGGIAGAGVMSPFAISRMKEGKTLEGIGQLGAGAVMGAGTGLMGRTALRSSLLAKTQQAQIDQLTRELAEANKGLGNRIFNAGKEAVGKIGEGIKEVAGKTTKAIKDKVVTPQRHRNIGMIGGGLIGAGLSSSSAQRSIEEDEKIKGYTQLALGTLLGTAAGNLSAPGFKLLR